MLNEYIGSDELRDGVIRGLLKGRSFALVGGHKCGGTLLLRSIHERLRRTAPSPGTIACYFDIRSAVPRTPSDFFREVFRLVTGTPVDSTCEFTYAEFLRRLEQELPALTALHGPDWLAVIFIDALDAAVAALPNQDCLQNLRNLLTQSEFRRHLRVVAWGAQGMMKLTEPAAPLSNLDVKYLRVMRSDEAWQVVTASGLGDRLPLPLAAKLIDICGRQPYLLIGALRQLEDAPPGSIDETSVYAAASKHLRDRAGVLTAWLKELGPDACRVYQALLDGPAEGLPRAELRARLPQILPLDPALLVLSYHCLIDEASADDHVQAPGTIFRRWFRDNWSGGEVAATAPPPVDVAQAPSKNVFVVHGRNRRVRNSMFLFLRSLGLQPIEWHEAVSATGNAAPHIREILQQGLEMAKSVVVLLTPDDAACLQPEFVNADDPIYERQPTGQPRPNVLFEAGMAFAALPKSTILVRLGEIRPFSDIAGIQVVQLTGGRLDQRIELIRRLKLAGCAVDDSGLDWHTQDDFAMRKSEAAGV